MCWFSCWGHLNADRKILPSLSLNGMDVHWYAAQEKEMAFSYAHSISLGKYHPFTEKSDMVWFSQILIHQLVLLCCAALCCAVLLAVVWLTTLNGWDETRTEIVVKCASVQRMTMIKKRENHSCLLLWLVGRRIGPPELIQIRMNNNRGVDWE